VANGGHHGPRPDPGRGDASDRRGAKATTIRAVAEEAGVTPGLVSHHFGTKHGLREACDAYVLDYLRDVITEGVDEQGVGDPGYLATVYQSAPAVLRYVSRALVDGSAAAASLFDSFVALTAEYLASHPPHGSADRQTQAAVLVAMRLGVWVLHPHLLRALGADTLTPAVLSRLSAAVLDVISPDFAGPDLIALARAGLTRYQQTAIGSE
jgi:AcrR family transcriptional regulator